MNPIVNQQNGLFLCTAGTIDAAEVAKLKAEGLGASEIARRLGIARASVYRVLEACPQ
jgi:hypothetical protein